jgi:lysine-N-methylase
MKQVYPDYYDRFACTASACAHTCCTGWEIDVDTAALARWREADGEFGERLKNSIAPGGEPHFILGAGERCPFLNSENLCDIILTLGEGGLCDICADHPRFRTFLSDRTETGLGLCCEEAGRLLFSHKDPVSLISRGGERLTREENALLTLRGRAMDAVQDRTRTIPQRIGAMLAVCGAEPDVRPVRYWAGFLLELERMDEKWTELLEGLPAGDAAIQAFDAHMASRAHEYENLLWYLLFRHFMSALDDGDVVSKLRFAALGYGLIRALGAAELARTGSFDTPDMAELARLFSSEIEYSDENLDAVFDALA